jgi:predicted enzyme related to lactoylglutathione lyase
VTDPTPAGAPCWLDLLSTDTAKSVAFYGDLFGWTAEDPNEEFGGYINFNLDGVRVAGCMNNDGSSGSPDVWGAYLKVDDAKETVDAAVAHGGAVMVPAMDVGDLGTMAIVTDDGGAAIGMWRPGQHLGFGAWSVPGAPAWFELHTRDYDKAVAFYTDVFKWDAHTMSDAAEFRYTTLGEGDDALAGIMDATGFLPDGVPSHWSIYFRVADTDAALAKVTELGGKVVTPAEDTPYGRLATATDSTGAQFKLLAR